MSDDYLTKCEVCQAIDTVILLDVLGSVIAQDSFIDVHPVHCIWVVQCLLCEHTQRINQKVRRD